MLVPLLEDGSGGHEQGRNGGGGQCLHSITGSDPTPRPSERLNQDLMLCCGRVELEAF